jgi:hypothetical protein
MSDQSVVNEFQELCRREFRFLEEDYGFAEREVEKESTIRNPFQVQYVSPKTVVRVLSQSYGSSLVVLFGPTEPGAREIYRWYDLSLCCKFAVPTCRLKGLLAVSQCLT